ISVLLLFKIYHRDIRILFCERNCDRAANPAVATSDDRHFISQFPTAALFFTLGFGPWLHLVFAAWLSLLMLRWLKFFFLGHKPIRYVLIARSLFQKGRHSRPLFKPRAILAAAFARARGFLCCGRT